MPKEPLERRKGKLVALMVQKIDHLQQQAGRPRMDKYKLAAATEKVELLLQSGTVTETDLKRIANGVLQEPVRLPASDPIDYDRSQKLQLTSLPTIENDLWAKVTTLDVQKYNIEQAEALRKQRQCKIAQRIALDAQVRQRQEQQQHHQQQELMYAEYEQKKREEWMHEQEEQAVRRKQQNRQEQKTRELQVMEFEKQRKAEAQRRLAEERVIAEHIKNDIYLERQAELDRKLKERADIAKFLDYNKKQRELKQSLHIAEQEADKQHQREFLAKLEQQEVERELALKRMYDRQQYQASMAHKLQCDFLQRDQQATAKEEKEYMDMYDKMLQEEQQKQKQAKVEQQRIKHVLAHQIQLKEAEREKERRELLEQRKRLAEDIHDAETKEVLRRLHRRELETHHRRALRLQIEEKARAPQLSMSETELRLNSRLLGYVACTS